MSNPSARNARPAPPSDDCARRCIAKAASKKPGHVAVHSIDCPRRTTEDTLWVIGQWHPEAETVS